MPKLPSFPPKPEEWKPGTPFEEPPLPKWMLESKVIRFTRRVLGPGATEKLLDKELTQTIRTDKEIRYDVGEVVKITLDGGDMGEAEIISIDKVKLSDLDEDDAERGGFDNIAELRRALARAGFRFRELERYTENRVIFRWLELRNYET